MTTRAIQKEQRDNVRRIETADALILQNERTGETVSLPLDASAWQRREAIKQLQPAQDSTFDTPLVPRTPATSDKPLPVPVTPGILARKRAQENAEYAAKVQAEKDRAQKLADDRRIAELTAEKLAERMAAQPQPESAPVDLGDVIKRRWEATATLTKLRADPNAEPAALAAAENENAAAWGFAAPEGAGGANE
jgi:hypothetical protein